MTAVLQRVNQAHFLPGVTVIRNRKLWWLLSRMIQIILTIGQRYSGTARNQEVPTTQDYHTNGLVLENFCACYWCQ